jgi:hypothetical protein
MPCARSVSLHSHGQECEKGSCRGRLCGSCRTLPCRVPGEDVFRQVSSLFDGLPDRQDPLLLPVLSVVEGSIGSPDAGAPSGPWRGPLVRPAKEAGRGKGEAERWEEDH